MVIVMELHVLVGLPFSGKTAYYEKKLKLKLPEDHIRVNPREIKNILKASGVSDEEVNKYCFKIMMDRIRKGLRDGKIVVYDATNITKVERKKLIKEAKKHKAKIIAYVINPPLKVCLERNKKLGGIISEKKLRKLYKKFELPTEKEGFDKVILVNWRKIEWD